MPRIQVNFHLYAENIARAALFYQEHFDFKIEGQLGEEWVVMRTENAVIWLGTGGAKNGLVILVDDDIEIYSGNLKSSGIDVFIPREYQTDGSADILKTSWGRHVWMLDTEQNLVMIFQPAYG